MYELITHDDLPLVRRWLACERRPFGYLQCYDPDAWDGAGFGPHPIGTWGIDQFIGEIDMLDRGHGSAFIRSFHRPPNEGGHATHCHRP